MKIADNHKLILAIKISGSNTRNTLQRMRTELEAVLFKKGTLTTVDSDILLLDLKENKLTESSQRRLKIELKSIIEGVEETDSEIFTTLIPLPNPEVTDWLKGYSDRDIMIIIKELIIKEILTLKDTIKRYNLEDVIAKIKLYLWGLDKNIFEHKLYVQPKFRIKNKQCIGGEVLSRLNHEYGTISPVVFIKTLSKLNMLKNLDILVLEKVLEEINQNQDLYSKDCKLSVNLSLVNFEDESILDKIQLILSKYPKEVLDCLDIEITEYSVFRDNIVDTLNMVMDNLGNMVHFHLDDVASPNGYASITLLAKLKFEKVKVDKALTDIIDTQRGQKALLSLKEYCNNLGSSLIVEGVEYIHQLDLLERMGVDEVQGFIFSKPIPLEEYRKIYLKDKNLAHEHIVTKSILQEKNKQNEIDSILEELQKTEKERLEKIEQINKMKDFSLKSTSLECKGDLANSCEIREMIG